MTTEPQEYVYSDARSGQPGLTKREYFAAMAMQGLIDNDVNPAYYPNRAKEAVQMADALINALNQPQP